MSSEDISILIKEKSDAAFSEIYERIKSESVSYKELKENVGRVIETVRYENPSLGNLLNDVLSDKVEQESNQLLLKNGREVLYMCDGMVPGCRKSNCYKNDGLCRHTKDISHAVNFADFAGDTGN